MLPLEASQIETHFERAAVSVRGFRQKCLQHSLHMSTPDVRFLLTMFLPQANVQSRTKRKGADRQMEARCIGDHLNVNTDLQDRGFSKL